MGRPLPSVEFYFHDNVNLDEQDVDERNYTSVGRQVKIEFVAKENVVVYGQAPKCQYTTADFTYRHGITKNCMAVVTGLVLEPTALWAARVDRSTKPAGPVDVTIDIVVTLEGATRPLSATPAHVTVDPRFPAQLVLVDEPGRRDLPPVSHRQ